MNTLQEREMRRHMLAKDSVQKHLPTFSKIRRVRNFLTQVLANVVPLESNTDNRLKTFDGLDEASGYSTPEEMTEMLDVLQQWRQASVPDSHFHRVTFYIDDNHRIRWQVGRITTLMVRNND